MTVPGTDLDDEVKVFTELCLNALEIAATCAAGCLDGTRGVEWTPVTALVAVWLAAKLVVLGGVVVVACPPFARHATMYRAVRHATNFYLGSMVLLLLLSIRGFHYLSLAMVAGCINDVVAGVRIVTSTAVPYSLDMQLSLDDEPEKPALLHPPPLCAFDASQSGSAESAHAR